MWGHKLQPLFPALPQSGSRPHSLREILGNGLAQQQHNAAATDAAADVDGRWLAAKELVASPAAQLLIQTPLSKAFLWEFTMVSTHRSKNRGSQEAPKPECHVNSNHHLQYLLWHDLTSEQHSSPMLYISQTPSAIETKPFPSILAEAPAEDTTHHFGSPQARFHKAMSADAQTNDSPLVLNWNYYLDLFMFMTEFLETINFWDSSVICTNHWSFTHASCSTAKLRAQLELIISTTKFE